MPLLLTVLLSNFLTHAHASYFLTVLPSHTHLPSKRVALKEMEDKFESLIEGMLDHHYGIVDDFIPQALVERLRANLLHRIDSGQMINAGVGQHASYHENGKVRMDKISWIEDDHSDVAEEKYHRLLWSFIGYLNTTCYTGLNGFESHFAVYGIGSFYKRHLDQFKTDSGRKYSVVLYLNDLWEETDGGQLVMYDGEEHIMVSPKGGRAVFFESDRIPHEVLPASRTRMSIAGWMKRV
jgi:SM-20-related protein